ncbi:hypothetical protein LOZ39_002062 [Ophidiomyces ophidiicola]|nr:hypothetical protein LOZ61_002379 [Ophidiomyces ophidiicola]KAI1918805.1 hypothetical protein LOZ64_002565 [Ophidiomyces ophidiicola]KAI1926230.1 hypothetical protein LOZ60_003706 [Ophidiomyces ophidiicola]KAI1956948.1 hypothetical protein LOZ59_004118 [Ophidiomyces ophidiicola]KAI2015009.1 hypothetical protein LOZ49_000928 [Ophidiomyces ophidiicola]
MSGRLGAYLHAALRARMERAAKANRLLETITKNAGKREYAPHLLSLPPELLYHILSYLPATTLASLSSTCRCLREHVADDQVWALLVNSFLHKPLRDPAPFESFRSLYITYHPFWFIVQGKIWYSDVKNTGKVIIVRYNAQRGRIEGYRIVAAQPFRNYDLWSKDTSIFINSFEPQVSLWLDDPVILLDRVAISTWNSNLERPREYRMPMQLETQRVFTSIFFCKAADPDEWENEDKSVWPPLNIDAVERVDVTYSDFESSVLLDKPLRQSEISEAGFRIRRWIQFGGNLSAFDTGTMMDGVSTYGTLDPKLYTPTAEFPYQGIWVGDYSGHGAEFLVIMQSECMPLSFYSHEKIAENVLRANRGTLPKAFSSTDGIQRGGLIAVKLTGDPNVPRGEVSFYADEIGPNGTIRIADEPEFHGARVVSSWGHVAGTDFTGVTQSDEFGMSELFLLSHDCIAHFWLELGHISYYRRVNLDTLLNQ